MTQSYVAKYNRDPMAGSKVTTKEIGDLMFTMMPGYVWFVDFTWYRIFACTCTREKSHCIVCQVLPFLHLLYFLFYMQHLCSFKLLPI